MTKFFSLTACTLICLLTLSCMGRAGGTGPDKTNLLAAGSNLPSFSVTTSTGQTVSPATLKGSVAVIAFFNTECRDCRRELPMLQKLYAEMGRDVRFVCIARAETDSSVCAYWRENDLHLPYSAQPDRKVYSLFAQRVIPRIYVVKPDGTVAATFAERVAERRLRRAIAEAAN